MGSAASGDSAAMLETMLLVIRSSHDVDLFRMITTADFLDESTVLLRVPRQMDHVVLRGHPAGSHS